jgi:uncharacterized protein YgbK (DUF1537 family)
MQVECLAARGLRVVTPADAARPRDLAPVDLVLMASPDHAAARRSGEAVVAELATAASRMIESWRSRGGAPPTLVLTGGATARAVCRALGAAGIRLTGELSPGLAWGTLLDGPAAHLVVVTKAGGFGDPDTLVRLWESAA